MSQTLEAPDLHRWLARLSPAQEQHLRTIIRSDDELPDVVDIADDPADDPCGPGPVDESVPDEFLKLIGSITDAPGDWGANASRYARQRAQDKHERESREWRARP